eukprot:3889323-Rhodomonas_salina.1
MSRSGAADVAPRGGPAALCLRRRRRTGTRRHAAIERDHVPGAGGARVAGARRAVRRAVPGARAAQRDAGEAAAAVPRARHRGGREHDDDVAAADAGGRRAAGAPRWEDGRVPGGGGLLRVPGSLPAADVPGEPRVHGPVHGGQRGGGHEVAAAAGVRRLAHGGAEHAPRGEVPTAAGAVRGVSVRAAVHRAVGGVSHGRAAGHARPPRLRARDRGADVSAPRLPLCGDSPGVARADGVNVLAHLRADGLPHEGVARVVLVVGVDVRHLVGMQGDGHHVLCGDEGEQKGPRGHVE